MKAATAYLPHEKNPLRPSSVIVYALTGMAVAATIRQRATTGKKTDADGFSTTSFDAFAPGFTTSIILPVRSSS